MFIGFINAFSTEGKNAKTIEKLKLFLEKKTNLSLKYSQCVSSGYFENHSIQASVAYWEWFEARLIASELYYEVLDIFGAITNRKHICYYHGVGHGKAYYRRVLPAEEFFAEYFSLCAADERFQLDILQSAFPETVKEYNRIMKGLYTTYEGAIL